MKQGKNIFLLGSVLLIVLAIGLVAVLDRVGSPGSSSTDVRARASGVNALKFNGIVATVDEVKGVLTVNDLHFAAESRSGEAVNLGVWTVTPPPGFDYATTPEGTQVVIGVDSKTFQITSHSITALTIVPGVQ